MTIRYVRSAPKATADCIVHVDAAYNGIDDDSPRLQAAVDSVLGLNGSGVVVMSPGPMRLSSPIVVAGALSYAVELRGEAATGGLSGTVLKYDGEAGPDKAVIEIRGGAGLKMSRLAIDAKAARYGVRAAYDRDRGVGVSELTLEHVYVEGESWSAADPLSACLAFGVLPDGTLDTNQCDAVTVVGGKLAGHAYGVRTGTANVANVVLREIGLVGSRVLVSIRAGGACSIVDCRGGASGWHDIDCGANGVRVVGFYSEGSPMFFSGTANLANMAPVTLDSCRWAGLASGGPFIRHSGQLRIVQGLFQDLSPGSPPPKIQCQDVDADASSVVSEQNHYRFAASLSDVFVDSNGDPVPLAHVRSFGDVGGDGGALVRLS